MAPYFQTMCLNVFDMLYMWNFDGLNDRRTDLNGKSA